MKNRQLKWERLDNTANLFPVIATESMTNVYRMSVTLFEDIDPEILNESVEKILPLFDYFRFKMKKGIFWYYFEENLRPFPGVKPENTYPCSFIHQYENNEYLFRVTYFKKRINLEVFHALADGSGALNFLLELTYQYLRLKYPENFAGKVNDGLYKNTSLDREDSYLKNYKKSAKKSYKSEKSVVIKGSKLPKSMLGIMHGYINIPQIKAVAKEYGVTINQYLLAVYIYAIYNDYLNGQASDRPITVAVPVNIRPYFDSITTKNFFVMVSCVFKPEKESYSFEEVLAITTESLKSQVTKENLEKLFSYNVSNEKKLVLRAVPLFIKGIAIKSIYVKLAHANTSTVTNMGVFDVAEEYRDYIDKFHIAISMSTGQNLKGAVCSFNDTMVFTFTSALKETTVQKGFFRKLANDGIDVSIETNGVYYESMS